MTVAHAHGETQVGMIMGTAPYMAPEQARGKPVDKRADIWAFGVVLFEMLSGRRAFVGDSVTDILARVIERDPDWSALPPATPPHIRRLVERCLAKDPKARLRDIAEARVIIEDKAPLPVSGATAVFVPATAPSPAPARFARLWSLPIVAAAVAGAVLAMAALWLTRTPTSIVTPGVMVEASLGADGVIDTAGVADVGASLALSRDGQQLAFVALDAAGQTNLFVRGLQQLDAKRLPGTEGASSPFFAPDGQSIGFFAHGKLKKVTLAGIVTSLADAPHGRGGVFTDDGRILYSPNSPSGIVLMSVPTDGGTPTKLLPLMPGEATQRWPQILPGGKTVLYTSHRSVAGFDRAEIVAAPLDGGAPKVVLKGAYDACYLPSGHLLFMRQGTLFAIAFDLATLTPRGEPEPLAQHVSSSTIHGSASFAVSPAGVLAYVSGPVVSKTRPIYWMNRAGALTPLRETPLDWDSPRVSPDGRFIAMTIDEGERENVFVYDPARDLLTRIASADMNSQGAVWAPDGKHIAFAADVDGARNLFWARSDGSGGIERLTRSPRIQVPTSFDPTGKQLAYFEVNPETKMDAMLLPLEGSDAQGWRGGASVPIANTPANEGPAAISPDGRWVAYASEVSGRVELYVQKFPGVGPRIQISTDGAQYPVWSRTKSELFYEGPGSVIMVAPYRVNGESLIPEKPRAWSPVRFWNPGARWAYDLHPDGQRFVVSKVPTADGARGDQVVLSTELFAQLQRLVPTKR